LPDLSDERAEGELNLLQQLELDLEGLLAALEELRTRLIDLRRALREEILNALATELLGVLHELLLHVREEQLAVLEEGLVLLVLEQRHEFNEPVLDLDDQLDHALLVQEGDLNVFQLVCEVEALTLLRRGRVLASR